MAGKKRFKDMPDAIAAISAYRAGEAEVRADYAARAEAEIAKLRANVLDVLFVTHADSGPSEIANSTGLSRSTVIRWRKEFAERGGADDKQVGAFAVSEEAVESIGDHAILGESQERTNRTPNFTFSKQHDSEQNVDYHFVMNSDTGESVYVIWDQVYGVGESASELVMVPRPDWLTDEIIDQAEESLGFPVPGKKRA